MNKVFDTYFGGKSGSGVAQQIINELRPHDVYIEPFLGNGSVYRYKKAARINILNDLDPLVVERWSRSGVAVLNYAAVDLLQRYPFLPERRYCLYLDPPYPLGSRRSARKVYNYEMTDDDHRELLTVIINLPGCVDVCISTYENDLYKTYLSGWRLKTFNSQTRQGPAVEYLYMNYSNPTGLLHDYRHLGTDRTDRQRIRRKINREIEKLNRLPVLERNAIIFEILNQSTVDESNYHR